MAAPASARRRRVFAALGMSVLAGLCGCMSHTHRIGLGPTGIGESSTRQLYLFFGLMQVNEVDVQRMTDNLTSYAVETEYSFVDLLLAPLLLPLTMTSRTVTVHR